MTGKIDIQRVKLAEGGRLLRFSEKTTGLSLEKRLSAQEAVVGQKARLLRGFEQLLSRELALIH